MKNKIVFVIIFAMITVLLIGQITTSAQSGPTLEELEGYAKSECEEAGGTYKSLGDGKGVCTELTEDWTVNRVCGNSNYDYVTLFGDYAHGNNPTYPLDYVVDYTCGNFPRLSLKEQGTAKIKTIASEAYLGGTIKVSGVGVPSFLRLKANGVIYKLPVIPGSIQQLPDGTFTAEFYTINPLTSQPFVGPGSYLADCFGAFGPAGGQFEITITR